MRRGEGFAQHGFVAAVRFGKAALDHDQIVEQRRAGVWKRDQAPHRGLVEIRDVEGNVRDDAGFDALDAGQPRDLGSERERRA